MSILTWDEVGEHVFETGVDHGVLYIPTSGVYDDGVAWNGLTAVTEKPTGAEANAQYADNIKYLNLISAEQFGATVEAYTYPDEFQQFDGLASPQAGVTVGQQNRGVFGLSYRTKIGNDVDGNAAGYKLHLVYGCQAAPSEKAYATINDSPEAIVFSWEVATTPVAVTDLTPTSILTIDSTKADATALAALELILYGDLAVDPRLPLPDEVIALMDGTFTTISSDAITAPTYNSTTDLVTIPTVAGVTYYLNGVEVAAGTHPITEDATVTATADEGYVFEAGSVPAWFFNFV